MSSPSPAADARGAFDRIVERYATRPDVELGTGFGAIPGLRVSKRIFAMLARDELVLKLPRARVDALVDAGAATRFDPGHGRLMKEWASVPYGTETDWDALADEAFLFVSGAGGAGGAGGGAARA